MVTFGYDGRRRRLLRSAIRAALAGHRTTSVSATWNAGLVHCIDSMARDLHTDHSRFFVSCRLCMPGHKAQQAPHRRIAAPIPASTSDHVIATRGGPRPCFILTATARAVLDGRHARPSRTHKGSPLDVGALITRTWDAFLVILSSFVALSSLLQRRQCRVMVSLLSLFTGKKKSRRAPSPPPSGALTSASHTANGSPAASRKLGGRFLSLRHKPTPGRPADVSSRRASSDITRKKSNKRASKDGLPKLALGWELGSTTGDILGLQGVGRPPRLNSEEQKVLDGIRWSLDEVAKGWNCFGQALMDVGESVRDAQV